MSRSAHILMNNSTFRNYLRFMLKGSETLYNLIIPSRIMFRASKVYLLICLVKKKLKKLEPKIRKIKSGSNFFGFYLKKKHNYISH